MTPTPTPVAPTALPSSTVVPSPTPSPTRALAEAARRVLDGNQAAANTTTCTSGDGTVCGLLRHVGLSDAWAKALVAYGEPLLKIILILVVAVALRRVLARLIHRLSEHIATGESRSLLGGPQDGDPGDAGGGSGAPGGTVAWERRAQRARTVGSVLGSLTTGVISVLAVLLVLGEVGLDLAPLLAGASVIGVAVGFGAQSLVKDFLSGIFLIAEDQFGVGDNIDLANGTSGTVEAVGLRVTRLRSVDGTVWYVRNGEVLRVGNRSQGWARAVLDVDVAYREDVAAVEAAMASAGAAVHDDPDWAEKLLEEPVVWGIEALSAEKVVIRLAARTAPGQQWEVSRELRRAIKERFDIAGIGHEVQAG